jgi:hypothetical protein
MVNRTGPTPSPSDREARLFALQELREIGLIDRQELAAETTLLLGSRPASDIAPLDRAEYAFHPVRMTLRRVLSRSMATPTRDEGVTE